MSMTGLSSEPLWNSSSEEKSAPLKVKQEPVPTEIFPKPGQEAGDGESFNTS